MVFPCEWRVQLQWDPASRHEAHRSQAIDTKLASNISLISNAADRPREDGSQQPLAGNRRAVSFKNDTRAAIALRFSLWIMFLLAERDIQIRVGRRQVV